MENSPIRPLVSILIPSYNHAAYICTCLNSILEDDYSNKEIIVIDDGSTDETFDTIRLWREMHKDKFKYPFKLIFRENRGVAKTLNELVSYARGEYLCPIASDDYLLPGGIEERVAYLVANLDRKAVFGNSIVVDNKGKEILESSIKNRRQKKFLSNNNLIASELIFNWCISGPVLMVKREVYDHTAGYDEKLVIEDWDFYLKLCARGWLGFIDFPVGAYRVHDKNTCHNSQVWMKSKESQYFCVSNNYFYFTGLNKWNLYAKKLILQSKVGNDKDNLLKRYVYLSIGRNLNQITKWLYKIKRLFYLFRL